MLTAGARLGGYEIQSILGVGGMGEVYRARDTKLNRDVAVKVLRASVAGDPERLARFQREAHVLASLNHPNIAQIYGLEDSGAVHGLVMELVEGPTLADRIALGPIPWSEALPIVMQIADALETAHEQGIIHRDLKPANIKVRPDGAVKVLDFGLAKALEPGYSPDPSAMSSPTLTAATQYGVILGTAAYMSPEQAKGRPADKRSDVWGFGCVLYEMLSGRRAFDGEDVSEVLASVIKTEPDLTALPAGVPRGIRTLVARCLAKDRKRRIPEIATVRFLLDEASSSDVPLPSQAAVSRPAPWTLAAAIVVTAVVATAATALLKTAPSEPPPLSPIARFDIVLPSNQTQPRGLAISPDGQTIVYSANRQLYVRTMSDPVVRPLSGTPQLGIGPFFSPDGKWVGFFAPDDGVLRKVALTGGAPITICPSGLPGGAVWTPGGDILVAVAGTGISRVPAAGGEAKVVVAAKPGESMQAPQMLADGDHVVFAITTATGSDRWDRAQIVAQSLATGERRVLVEGGSNPRVAIPNQLLYALGTTLLAVGFDARTLTVHGSPIPLIQQVARAPGPGLVGVGIAGNGTIVHLVDNDSIDSPTKPALIDRSGARKVLPVPEGLYSLPRISPDGRQLAIRKDDQGRSSLWIYELSGATSMRRLTFEPATALIWSRDGKDVIFGSTRQTGTALYRQRADGSGSEERLTDLTANDAYFPNDQTVDGKTLAFFTARNGGDVWTVPLAGTHTPAPLISVPTTHQDHLSFSRDGRWMAYRSNESGRYEIYVQPYPPTGVKYQVTTTGAHSPLWSPDGRQLFYVDVKEGAGRLASVDVRAQSGFAVSNPTRLPMDTTFDENLRPYDVTPDGKQFVVVVPAAEGKPDQPAGLQLRVTLNAIEDLKKR
jgi:serine/threonine-protein kinase